MAQTIASDTLAIYREQHSEKLVKVCDALVTIAVVGQGLSDLLAEAQNLGIDLHSSEALDEALAQALPVIQRLHFKEFDA